MMAEMKQGERGGQWSARRCTRSVCSCAGVHTRAGLAVEMSARAKRRAASAECWNDGAGAIERYGGRLNQSFISSVLVS